MHASVLSAISFAASDECDRLWPSSTAALCSCTLLSLSYKSPERAANAAPEATLSLKLTGRFHTGQARRVCQVSRYFVQSRMQHSSWLCVEITPNCGWRSYTGSQSAICKITPPPPSILANSALHHYAINFAGVSLEALCELQKKTKESLQIKMK